MKAKYDVLLLKLHPHIKQPKKNLEIFQILEQNVMLELYLLELLKNNNSVTVYHDNSFAVFYFMKDIETKYWRFRPAYNDVEKNTPD